MVINPIVGVYIYTHYPIKGGMTIPNIATFDHGTSEETTSVDLSEGDAGITVGRAAEGPASWLIRHPAAMAKREMATWWFMVRNNYLGVSKNRGSPKWMVKIMENPIKMDDLGVPLFLETPIWGC